MIVKYWSYLLAKLVAAAWLMRMVWVVIRSFYPRAEPGLFATDLSYTTAMMFFFLFSAGLVYLVIWDQRYRCRTCLRRLRMPVAAGSWPNMLLFGQPRMEYICLYGHGTLKVPEVELNGGKSPDWQPHDDDVFKELEALEAGKK
jgi:hypothetical protein